MTRIILALVILASSSVLAQQTTTTTETQKIAQIMMASPGCPSINLTVNRTEKIGASIRTTINYVIRDCNGILKNKQFVSILDEGFDGTTLNITSPIVVQVTWSIKDLWKNTFDGFWTYDREDRTSQTQRQLINSVKALPIGYVDGHPLTVNHTGSVTNTSNVIQNITN